MSVLSGPNFNRKTAKKKKKKERKSPLQISIRPLGFETTRFPPKAGEIPIEVKLWLRFHGFASAKLKVKDQEQCLQSC